MAPGTQSETALAAETQRIVILALLCAAVAAVPVLGTADAKKKGKSIAGKYVGKTEYFGSLSFKLTRAGKILNFTLTDATLYCQVVAPPGTPENPEYEKVVTITHGPMSMEKKSKKNPQGKRFEVTDPTPDGSANQGGYFKAGIVPLTSGPDGGRVLNEMGFNGETYWETSSGPVNLTRQRAVRNQADRLGGEGPQAQRASSRSATAAT